ncbi:glycosyltransferase family 2 protein [Rheinheimera marina]|uniref:Glycosyltransferase family 2 protein n=1 Tax=Rheinheimera marina TaxID=1774958 RepID=A0ABV9JRP1_9GAMM
MEKTPFISIVLPTRDRAKLVEQCLTCIKQQDFADYEVIISDNPVAESCSEVVAPFLSDPRFKYFRQPQPVSMPDNWEYAAEQATGEYVTVINEKFMFRPDAFSVIQRLAKDRNPDIISWQFDYFELCDHEKITGSYHPLLKPVEPSCYSAEIELKRRLDFIEPLFSRHQQHKNGYGKIYSGCVKNDIVREVRALYGRVFMPMSPDFTSMICFLNLSENCIDVGQSLMLVVSGSNISNGVTTLKSVRAFKKFIQETVPDFDHYRSSLVIADFWVGHSVFIASDYQRMKDIFDKGKISNMQLGIASLVGWAKEELHLVEDWGDEDRTHFESVLTDFYSGLTQSERNLVDNIAVENEHHRAACSREIYHSGLAKADYFIEGISARQLAELHWLKKVALPRRNVGLEELTVSEAVDYLYQYNKESRKILGLL